jgi:prevent-host-death family protein
MKQISIQQTRDNLAEIINQVSAGGQAFLITKYNKPKAKIVPYTEEKNKKQILKNVYGIWEQRKDIKSGVEYEDKVRQKRYEEIFS